MVDPVKKVANKDTELRGDDAPRGPAPAAKTPAPALADAAALRAQLQKMDEWVARMHDPELGGVGLAFKQATQNLVREEKPELDLPFSASYYSFLYAPDEGQDGYSNYVSYGRAALENPERLLSARTHEFVHALQYDQAAPLHADPYNSASNIITSPYDYLLRKERLEQDAYVKGAWLCSLAEGDAPGIVKAMEGIPLPVSVFKDLREKTSSLQDAFAAAADACRNREGVWSDKNQRSAIADEWHARALDEYDHMLALRHKTLKSGESLTIVRLEGHDIRAIGAAFGPNTFGDDDNNPALTTVAHLSPANAQKLAEIEKKYNIAPRDTLPSFDDALKAASTTRADFLTLSKQFKGSAAKPQPPAPANDTAAATAKPVRKQQNTGRQGPSR